MVAAQSTVKFTGLPGPELVRGCRARRKLPSGVQVGQCGGQRTVGLGLGSTNRNPPAGVQVKMENHCGDL